MTLLLIGFVGGLITGISPCVLPVLPVIFFSGGTQAARDREDSRNAFSGRRPYLVILGLVVSFSFFTLVGTFLLSLLHLPQSLIMWIGLVALVLVGVGLIVPRFQEILEKPFSRIPQRAVTNDRGGFLLGIALGAVYVPCAGPVLAAITVAGATGRISATTLLLTLAFAIGVAIPLLVFALAGRRLAERVAAFRRHQRGIRTASGIVMIALAVGLVFNVPAALQKLIPDYTSQLQAAAGGAQQLNSTLGFGGAKASTSATKASGSSASTACAERASNLVNCGAAPKFAGITGWFNTPGDNPLTLAGLRGKVVLIDFWAYSCINCQRATPHLNAWYKSYEKDGLVIVGVHAPEYAFEHVASNVMASAKQQGIRYPVALDNNFTTWTAYSNQYWPAEYLIDSVGNVRHIAFGEGDYGATENLIRQLLKKANPSTTLPRATDLADTTPTHTLTPETYLGDERVQLNFYDGKGQYTSGTSSYTLPAANPCIDCFAFGGKFDIDSEGITAVTPATIKLHYQAQHVYLNVGGTGTLTVTDADGTRTIKVSGPPDIKDLLKPGKYRNSTVSVTMSPGLKAYSFTFG